MASRQMGLSVILAVAALAGSVTIAEEANDQRRQAAEVKLEELKRRLALTPEQEQRLAPLVQARNEKMKALRDRNGGDASRRARLAMLQEARGIQEDFIAQVEPILTPEQMKEWDAIRAEMRDAAQERRRDR